MTTTDLEKLQKEFSTSPFWNFLGMEIQEFEEGNVVLTLPYKKEFDNVRGTVHGGVYMSIIDTTMGLFCRSLGFKDVATIQLNTQFLESIVKGTMTSTASIISRSKNTVLLEGRLFNDDGDMIGYGTGTFKIMK